MEIFSLARQQPCFDPRSSVVTIGVYDGVHRGHQATIGMAVKEARDRDLRSVVATFDPHPATVVRPEAAPQMIGTLAQRLARLAETGVDAVVIIDFDEQRSNESAREFVDEFVVGQLGAAKVIVGEGFHFGHNRGGDLGLLQNLGREWGFEATAAPLVGESGEPISSTRIRSAIAAGAFQAVTTMLGRVHETVGTVAHGDGRGGKALGFPTANLATERTVVYPADGVYAGWYRDDILGAREAAISVGRRPTFLDGAEPLIEAYVLDHDGDLYGRQAGVSFLERLRGQQRFDSIEDLIAQMHADIEEARKCLSQATMLSPSGRFHH